MKIAFEGTPERPLRTFLETNAVATANGWTVKAHRHSVVPPSTPFLEDIEGVRIAKISWSYLFCTGHERSVALLSETLNPKP